MSGLNQQMIGRALRPDPFDDMPIRTHYAALIESPDGEQKRHVWCGSRDVACRTGRLMAQAGYRFVALIAARRKSAVTYGDLLAPRWSGEAPRNWTLERKRK